MSWRLSMTEHVHQMRVGVIRLYGSPEWVRGVDLTPRIDDELLRLRGRYAYAMPGVEMQ